MYVCVCGGGHVTERCVSGSVSRRCVEAVGEGNGKVYICVCVPEEYSGSAIFCAFVLFVYIVHISE